MVHLVTSSGGTQVLLIIYCVVLSVTLSDPCMRCPSRRSLKVHVPGVDFCSISGQ